MRISCRCLVLALLFLPTFAFASIDINGARFAASVDARGQRLDLQGAGLLRYMVFIKAYAGALYTNEVVPLTQILGPVAKHLVLEYFHPISKEDFAKATRKKIADNITAAEGQNLTTRIDQLAGLYRDVEPGDRYALTHVPGEGVHLTLNGEWLGLVPGDDFARAAFAIWLGAHPIDKNFRNQLLGDA